MKDWRSLAHVKWDCQYHVVIIPKYRRKCQFTLHAVRLGFKAARPFYGRYALRRVIGALFNSSYYMKELYENTFSPFIPCYEIAYELTRIRDS